MRIEDRMQHMAPSLQERYRRRLRQSDLAFAIVAAIAGVQFMVIVYLLL